MHLSIGQKLRAISGLSIKSGIKTMDFDDIGLWIEKVGPNNDTSVLDIKVLEQIESIYQDFFE